MIVNLAASSQLLHQTLFNLRISCLKMWSGCDTESLSKIRKELSAMHIFVSWKPKHELAIAFRKAVLKASIQNLLFCKHQIIEQ